MTRACISKRSVDRARHTACPHAAAGFTRAGATVILAAGMLFEGALHALAVTPMTPPFLDNFSGHATGPLQSSGPWEAQLNGAGSSAEIAPDALSPSNPVCRAYNATVTLHVDPAENPTNTWTRLRIYPVPYNAAAEPPIPDSSQSFAFFINHLGSIRALNGEAWVTVGTAPLNQWLVFAVHCDHQERTWDLYFSATDSTSVRLTKLNPAPLAFRTGSNAARLEAVNMTGDGSLDDLAVGNDVRPVQDGANGASLLVRAETLEGGRQQSIGLLPYGYPAGQDNLAGEMGRDLFRGLQDNDTVVIHDTANHAYIRDSALPSGWDDTGKNGLELSEARIPPGSGVFVTKAASGPFVLFSDYDAIPPTQNRQLRGRQHGAFGLNLLAWDRDTPSAEAGTHGLGFAGQAGIGDKLYVPDPARGPNATKLLYWDAAGNRWMDAGAPARDRLSPGTAFWYVRRANADAAWMLGGAQ